MIAPPNTPCIPRSRSVRMTGYPGVARVRMTTAEERRQRAEACDWAQRQLDDPLGVGGKLAAKFVGAKMTPRLAYEMEAAAENLLVALRPSVLMLVRVQCTLHPEAAMVALRVHGRQRR